MKRVKIFSDAPVYSGRLQASINAWLESFSKSIIIHHVLQTDAGESGENARITITFIYSEIPQS